MGRTKIDVSLINIVTSILNMGSNKITNLANGTAASDAAAFGQITAANAGALPLTGGTLSGNLSFTTTSTQGVVGTTTNDNANAGNVGEAIRSFGQVSAASFPASGVWFNVTSISLTAGDWDVSGIVVFEAGPSASTSATGAALSFNSGNTTTDQVLGDNMGQGGATVANTSNVTLSIPTYRYSLATTTTVFIKAQLNYSTKAGMVVDGRISARRVR